MSVNNAHYNNKEQAMSVRIGVMGVGGKGTRFGRYDIQKCLMPVEGKPILEHTIDAFVACGVKLIFLLTEFLQEQVNAYLASRVYTEDNLVLATVYGSREGEVQSIHKLHGFLTEDFLYAGGDVIFPTETVQHLIQQAEKLQDAIAIMSVSSQIEIAPTHPAIAATADNSYMEEVSIFEADRRDKAVTLVSTGMYYFRPEVFPFLGQVRPYRPMGEFMQYAKRADKKIGVSVAENPWFCLHTQEDLQSWHLSAMRYHLMRQPQRCKGDSG